MNRPPCLAVATLFAGALLAGPIPLCAQQAKPSAEQGPPGGRPEPAGMVWVSIPGGKAKIGISRKALEALIKGTEVGRMFNVEQDIENELSISCPEHLVEVPPFWIAKYETTNAQYHRFLEAVAKVKYTVPPAGQFGERTLEEISRRYLVANSFTEMGGTLFYPVANTWKALYELNLDSLNPPVPGVDPKTQTGAEAFQNKTLPPGTEILCYRWTVPQTWRGPPAGHGVLAGDRGQPRGRHGLRRVLRLPHPHGV